MTAITYLYHRGLEDRIGVRILNENQPGICLDTAFICIDQLAGIV